MESIALVAAVLLGALILFVSVFLYEKWTLPLIFLAFFWAGMNLPLYEIWVRARWAVLLLVCLRGLAFLAGSRPRLDFGIPHMLAMAQAVIILLSTIYSVNPTVTFLKGGSIAALFVYAMIGARTVIIGREEVFHGRLRYLAEITVYALAISYWVIGHPLAGSISALGMLAGVISWPFLLNEFLSRKPSLSRLRSGFVLLLCFALLIYSRARASFLGAALSTSFLLLCQREHVKWVLRGLLVALALFGLFSLYPSLWTSFEESYVYKGSAELTASRKAYWDESMDLIREKPEFGYGFGVTQTSAGWWEGGFATGDADRERGTSLLTLVEGVGLIGSIPFFIFIWLLLRHLWRTSTRMRKTGGDIGLPEAFGGFVIGALGHSLLEGWLFAPGNYLCVMFWVFLFLYFDLMKARLARK